MTHVTSLISTMNSSTVCHDFTNFLLRKTHVNNVGYLLHSGLNMSFKIQHYLSNKHHAFRLVGDRIMKIFRSGTKCNTGIEHKDIPIALLYLIGKLYGLVLVSSCRTGIHQSRPSPLPGACFSCIVTNLHLLVI